MYETFIDLDELIVRCRDKSTKKFIQEAVACYRAGAYRSCIVATWNAVVFDFLHKLRQLEQLGDGQATELLRDFENKSSNSDFKGLWEFELNIPRKAREKFELISSVEEEDIKRLNSDRSRCAHPTMTSLEEPFEATAELARYHLRNAVMSFLQYPPVQGRAAQTRIFEEIKSNTFPPEPEKAIEYFKNGLLANARFNLIKDIVKGLTSSLLNKDYPDREIDRQFSALIAISKLYSEYTNKILNDNLSNLILKVTDENWYKVIIYLKKITAWENLSKPCIIKTETFIKSLDISDMNFDVLTDASYIDFLRDCIKKRLREESSWEHLFMIKDYLHKIENKSSEDVPLNEILNAILQDNYSYIVPEIVNRFIESNSYNDARKNAKELINIAFMLNDEQWESVLNSFCDNDQIYDACKGICPAEIIKLMFEENIKSVNASIQTHWKTFREKLNKFGERYLEIKNLKLTIDQHFSQNPSA